MKKIFLAITICLIITASAFCQEVSDQFTDEDLKGSWLYLKWPDNLINALGYKDTADKKYQVITFTDETYYMLGADQLDNDKDNFSLLQEGNYKIKNDIESNTQWLGLSNDNEEWDVVGLVKITDKNAFKGKFEGSEAVDLQSGDMVLVFYDADGKVKSKKQYRKLPPE